MPESNYAFVTGQGIFYGNHGAHDYVYHSGEPVFDSGQGGFIFESGQSFGSAFIIDDFEDGDLAEYAYQGNFSASTVRAFENYGQYSLYCPGYSGDDITYEMIGSSAFGTGVGNTYRWRVWLTHPQAEVGVMYGVQDGYDDWGDNRKLYNAEYQTANSSIPNLRLIEDDYDNGEQLGGGNFAVKENVGELPAGEWLIFEVEWGNPTHVFTIYDTDSQGDPNNELMSISGDSTYWPDGGIGINNEDEPAYVDYVTRVPQ